MMEPTAAAAEDRENQPRDSISTGNASRSDSGRPLRPRPSSLRSQDSNTRFSTSAGGMRASVFGRMSSTMSMTGGGALRDTFFGKARPDPLEESSNNEFNLTVIDEEGLIAKPHAEIIAPRLSGVLGQQWSKAGIIVVGIAVFMVVSTYTATLLSPTLSGYDIDPGLVLGSFQTLVMCTIVFITYHGVHVFQAHPNPIILFKCITDIVLAMRFLLDPWLLEAGVYKSLDRESCAFLSGFTQFLYFSSDCWYFTLIIDMYQSLTNPFTSVQSDRKKYIAGVCLAGLLSGWVTGSVRSFHGFADGNYCWTHRGDRQERNFWRLNVASWTVFYDWMIVFYLSGIAVLVYGVRRLRSGLKLTLDSRVEMLRNLAISIMSFTGYWTIVFSLYAISFSARTHYEDNGRMAPSKVFRSYSYALAGRGVVDYFVWFMINQPSLMTAHWMQFKAESVDKKYSAQLNQSLQRELIFFTIEGMTKAVQLADEELVRQRERSPTQEMLFREEDEEKQDLDDRLSFETPSSVPVMNLNSDRGSLASSATASTTGKAVLEEAGASSPPRERKSFLSQIGFPRSAETSSVLPGLKSPIGHTPPPPSEYTSEQRIKFTPYRSHSFAELRAACGISSSDFLKSFEASTKPSISEGASGAFMFFSGDKRFIVKSMAEGECRFLCDIAETYVEYLIKNPRSLITKFYGAFRITLYEKKFYFVVMENLFDVMEEGVTIHHRFDIKGSWVNRSYSRPRRGAKVKCRHCSMQFKYGANKKLLQCPNVVGLHEPNVVLKDNDMRTRMRIGSEAGLELYEQLCEDSRFLCELGIMDYSLLLGVTDIEFQVDPPVSDDLTRRNTVTSLVSSSSGHDLHKLRANTGSSNDISTVSTAPSSQAPSNLNLSDSILQSNSSTTRATATFSARSFHSSFSNASVNVSDGTEPPPTVLPREKSSMRKSERVFGPGFYYIGIIDILQQWNTQKKLERFWKVHVRRCDPNGLSAIDPVRYQRRFEAKLREIIAIPKEMYASRNSLFPHSTSPSTRRRSAPRPMRGRSRGGGEGEDVAMAANADEMDVALGPVAEEDDDDDESVNHLEQGAVRNPEQILMRVSSHPRSILTGGVGVSARSINTV